MDLPFFQDNSNILSVKYKKPIDQQIVDKLIYYIQSNSKKTTKVIVEISGTINSLVSGVLFKKALREKAIAMVFDFDTPKTDELMNIAKSLNLTIYILKRGAAFQKELSAYRFHKESDIKSFYKRFVNYHLSIQADMIKAAVVDTTSKSERLIYTKPDSFCGSFIPFYSLYKTEVYELAEFLKVGQPSDDYDYWKKIDPVLFLLLEKQINPEDISQQYNIDLHWLKRLKNQIDKQSLKTTISQFII